MSEENKNIDLPDLVERIMQAVVQIKTASGQGTGFFIRDDGLVITNKHVVGKDVFVKVSTRDHIEYDGQVCMGDPSTDYAFLFTNAPAKKVLSLSDSDSARVAETVVAIGHPYGYDFTVSEGIISAIERHEVVPGLNSVGFLQLDAGINPGNSGGPLVRKNGDVIGVITLTLIDAKGVSFAIPSNIIKKALDGFKNLSKEEALQGEYCTVCGFLNEVGEKYCTKCGATWIAPVRPPGFNDVRQSPLMADGNVLSEDAVACSTCGAYNTPTEKYCNKCGAALIHKAQSAVQSNVSSSQTASINEEVACTSCGTVGLKNAYCSKCGTKL